jgi:hypothetical protein
LRYGGYNNSYSGLNREDGMIEQEERKSRGVDSLHPESRELRHLWGIYVERRPKVYFIHRPVLITVAVAVVVLITVALFVDDDLAWSVCLAIRDHVAQIVHYTTNDIPHAFGIQ